MENAYSDKTRSCMNPQSSAYLTRDRHRSVDYERLGTLARGNAFLLGISVHDGKLAVGCL